MVTRVPGTNENCLTLFKIHLKKVPATLFSKGFVSTNHYVMALNLFVLFSTYCDVSISEYS